MKAPLPSCSAGVLAHHRAAQSVDCLGAHEGDGAASEPCACHVPTTPGTDLGMSTSTSSSAGRLRRGHAARNATRRIDGPERPNHPLRAHWRRPAPFRSRRPRGDSAAVRAHRRRRPRHAAWRGSRRAASPAPGAQPELRQPALAFGAAGVVLGRRQAARYTRVNGHERYASRKGNGPVLVRATVEQQRIPARPLADANWSIRPLLTPTNSFSAR